MNRAAGRALLVALLGIGCDRELGEIYPGVQSLRVEVKTPLGEEGARISDRTVVFDLTALGRHGQVEPLDLTANVRVFFLGTLSPPLGAEQPLAQVRLAGGVASGVQVSLGGAFGPSVIWVEADAAGPGGGAGSARASGASPTIYLPDPTLADVQRPPDESSVERNFRSQLEGKQLRVVASPGGKMVVTATYAQSFNLSDVDARGQVGPYGSLYVFTFQRPRVSVGDVLTELTGGSIEFNGMTEVSFPRWKPDPPMDRAALPAPAILDRFTLADPLAMERLEAGLVRVENAAVCPLDMNYDQYQQWALDLGNGCGFEQPVQVVTAGVVTGCDPPPPAGTVIPYVQGTLRNVALRDKNNTPFSFWILYPRGSDDVAGRGPCTL
jgi:hypothetical protein